MSYQRKDIPKLIALFTAAKDRIGNGAGTTYFLCHTLDKIASPGQEKALSLVRESIEGFYTLSSWVQATQRVETNHYTSAMNRRLRVRWCNKIIRDLQEYAK